jgi:hypothetical protein
MQFSTRTNLALAIVLLCSLFLALDSRTASAAQDFASPDFQRIWNRTDKQVATGGASRTWLWGPEPFTGAIQEDYAEAPGGKRLVQYFDKSRMEITNPNGDKSSPYYVTNGLIARELMTGKLQAGDNKFEDRIPAQIGVAGDPDDTQGPTYASLNGLTARTNQDIGGTITKAVARDGTQRDGSADFGKYGVKQGFYESSTGHNIAGPFWDFLNQSASVLGDNGQPVQGKLFDPVFYATGLPITDAYWARVKVSGDVKDVLVQAFERRVLTYTPSNSAAFQVEMGNIGRHYYEWRTKSVVPTPQSQPAVPACDVPESINGKVRPGKCVYSDMIVSLDATGFIPNDQIKFWLTDPNGNLFGNRRTYDVESKGEVRSFIFETKYMQPGLWYWTFEGHGNKATIYFRVQTGSPTYPNCPDVPESIKGGVRPSKCVLQGTPVLFGVWGFQRHEKVGFWLTSPDGTIVGTPRTVDIGPYGGTLSLPFETEGLAKGLWYWVFEGPTNRSVVYIRVD